MLSFLRWATFFVLIAVVVGALFSYPILRDRFFAPMLAAPAAEVNVLPSAETTPQLVAQASVTTSVTITAASTLTPTVTPTLAPTQARATVPALIIQAPSPTSTLSPTISAPTVAIGDAATPIATPLVLATTSLLPATATSTPSATSTATPSVTTVVTASIGIAVPVTPATATPTEIVGQAANVGEKGYLPPNEIPSVATPSLPVPALPTSTPIVMTPIVTPIVVNPQVVTTVVVSPTGSAAQVTPIVITTVQLTPQTGTPLPLGPTANANGPLYGGPDFNAIIVGQVTLGEPLVIVGIYTEGTWYLLANGTWLPGALVNNAPLTLPLVFPTVTPIPTNTPTLTPTPFPTATLVGSPTVSPTPTSLEAAVCDCSSDNRDCLGNIFANRAAAQSCFEYCFRQTGLDIHLLDPNLNGVACENLP